jgi:hypothetical protein
MFAAFVTKWWNQMSYGFKISLEKENNKRTRNLKTRAVRVLI